MIDQFIRLLATPEGNLIYYLVLSLSVFGALQSCLYASVNNLRPEGKRIQQGLLLLLIVQILLLIASWLAWLGVIDGHLYLPPLDRTFALFSLVMIIWLWAFPKSDTIPDALLPIFEVVIVVAGAIGTAWWLKQNSDLFFNTSIQGAYAYYSGFILLIIGLVLLLWRRPSGWGYGFFMLVIFLAGYLAQYFISQTAADYAWLVRLGEMVAYPILLALPKRLVGIKETSAAVEKVTPTLGKPRMDAKIIQSLINLLVETPPQQYYEELTRFVAHLMDADICLLMMPPKSGEQLIVPVGYNRLQDRAIDGFTADGHKLPSLLGAIQSGSPLRLAGGSGSEVQTLANELALNQSTNLLVAPFNPKGTKVVLGIVVLSKPADPMWSEDDGLKLKEITDLLVSKGGQISKGSSHQSDQEEIQNELNRAKAYVDQVRLEYAQLKARYDSLTSQATGAEAQAASITPLLASHKNLQDTVTHLETRNRELESLVAKGRLSLEEVEQLRQELRAALVELARIPSTLSRSDQKMLEQQLSTMKRLDDMQQSELVSSMAQELRQPISSIIGYTGLLLGESAGLLGAMQRKFLERVKAATERLNLLMNEMVEVVAIDGGKIDRMTASVNLDAVIDESVGNIIGQISEKNIALRVDVPEKLPAIQANKDAMQQILANLLQNACLVTPENGEIRLFARVEQKEDEPKYMHISVTDQGGGITKADLQRVFSRRYKVENPLIQGIGDTGVGLSIAKSLVELQKGRIWVDSQEGVGSTYSILLPLAVDQSGQVNQKASLP